MARSRINTINADELEAWVDAQEVEYANDQRRGERVSIKVRLATGEMTVTADDRVLYQGNDFDQAVTAFNEA